MAGTASPNGDIALCLSGGGLRATLFHLGVVRALRSATRDGKRAIDQVKEVYSVSGGSILAAHMMANWDRYVGDDAGFAGAEKAIFTVAHSNLRDRVLRRAITQKMAVFWPKWLAYKLVGKTFTRSLRSHWLQRQYQDFLGPETLADCAAKHPALPAFFILATSFRSAELCAFTNNGFEVEARGETLISGPPSAIPLATAVAASSAFPPMFPPISLPANILFGDGDGRATGNVLLSDGGIYDNLGVEKYRCRFLRDAGGVPGRLLISDGGAAFQTDDVQSFANVLGRNLRASDVLMDRVARATAEDVRNIVEIEDVMISIRPTGNQHNTEPTDDSLYGMVRTDLDGFDEQLCTLLTNWGEKVARTSLAEAGWAFAHSPDPHDEPNPAHRAALVAAGGRNMWTVFSGRRDQAWAWGLRATALAAVLVGLVLPIGGLAWYVNSKVEQGRREERDTLIATQQDLTVRYSALISDVQEEAFRNKDAGVLRIIAKAKDSLYKGSVEAQRRLDVLENKASAEVAQAPIAKGNAPSVVHAPQPVYIQFAGAFTREQIVALNSELRTAGWNVQSSSGERITSANGKHEVRYAGGNAKAASALADTINKSAIRPVEDVVAREMPVIGEKNLEVWIGN